MSTDTVETRLIAYRRDAPGADPVGDIDLTAILSATGGTLVDSFTLGAAASDEVHALPACTALLIISKDYRFSMKLRSGETAMTGLKLFAFSGDEADTAALASGNVLLSGNGSNAARIEIWAVRVGS